jgi:hypothetical protein
VGQRARFASLAVSSLAGVVLVSCSGAGSGSSRPDVGTSPTPDIVTTKYVALVHEFWIQEQAADVVSNGSNLAAKVCLGTDPPGSASRLQLVDPLQCGERAVALLAVHQNFLKELDSTPAPADFAADDQTFRTQIPKTIADLNVLISAAKTGNKGDVFRAATAYNNDMYPIVTDALNDVDPSVAHP